MRLRRTPLFASGAVIREGDNNHNQKPLYIFPRKTYLVHFHLTHHLLRTLNLKHPNPVSSQFSSLALVPAISQESFQQYILMKSVGNGMQMTLTLLSQYL